jgi:hypothetical protein
MRTQFFTGIFGLSLVLLLVIGPLYVADQLEGIETADSSIFTYEEVTEAGYEEEQIVPFWNFCQATGIVHDNEATVTETGAYFGENENPSSYSWDLVGYWDYFTAPTTAESSSLNLKGGISASQMLTAGVYDISLGIDYSGDYTVLDISWWRSMGVGYEISEIEPLPGTGDWFFTTYSGLNWFNISLTQENLIDASTTDGMYDNAGLLATISFGSGIDQGDIVGTNFQVSPEYMTETVTIGGNTSFIPYIRGISNPHTWTVWSLGFGGFFLVVVALFSSPIINFTRGAKK